MRAIQQDLERNCNFNASKMILPGYYLLKNEAIESNWIEETSFSTAIACEIRKMQVFHEQRERSLCENQ